MANRTVASADPQRATRDRNRSGWLRLTRNESVPYLVDASLDRPPRREGNQTDLAELAGVSRQLVSRRLDLRLAADIIEPVAGTNPQRYKFNPDNPVGEALVRLDEAMKAVGPNAAE